MKSHEFAESAIVGYQFSDITIINTMKWLELFLCFTIFKCSTNKDFRKHARIPFVHVLNASVIRLIKLIIKRIFFSLAVFINSLSLSVIIWIKLINNYKHEQQSENHSISCWCCAGGVCDIKVCIQMLLHGIDRNEKFAWQFYIN